MVLRKSHSALLSKYLDQYKKRPHSRVFAPLSEAYRKLGMLDEALKVLKEGIKRNPDYVLGYVVLAQVYADQFHWERVYQTLLPLTAHNKDNIALQKLFAKACLETGESESALDTYKWLLFLSPRDQEFAKQVAALEDDLLSKQRTIPREDLVKSPTPLPTKAQSFDINEDDWTMVNFAPENDDSLPKDAEENWTMSKAPASISSNKPEDWQVMSRQLDDDFFSDEEVTPEYAEAPQAEESQPLVSHTLVDLYVAQNHFTPAIELLEKFLEVNPRDERSRSKLQDLRRQANENRAHLQVVEEDGQAELLRLVTSQVQNTVPETSSTSDRIPSDRIHSDRISELYSAFLRHIHIRAGKARFQHA